MTNNNIILPLFYNIPGIASIYFITFGTAKDLRTSMNLDESILDTDIISIYGYTDDLRRRLVEHKNKYKNIQGANLALKYYSFVDKTQLSKAETDIRNYFISTNSHLEYSTEKEMVCVNDDTVKYLESHYSTVGKKFEGDKSETIAKMNEMEMKHCYEIKILNETHKKDIALKDVEILQWKVKYLENIVV